MKIQTKTHIYGIKAKGRKELLRHLKGGRLTPKQAALAKCYECSCRYADGKNSCKMPDCPLFPFMPYRNAN